MEAIKEINIGMTYTAKRFPNEKTETLFTVEDVYKTYNSKGELVKTRYAVSHVFMGQKVMNHEVLKVTIQRAVWNQAQK